MKVDNVFVVEFVFSNTSPAREVVLGRMEYVYNGSLVGNHYQLQSIRLETTSNENGADNLLDGMQADDMFLLCEYVRGWGLGFSAEWRYWIDGIEISCTVDFQELDKYLKDVSPGLNRYMLDTKVIG